MLHVIVTLYPEPIHIFSKRTKRFINLPIPILTPLPTTMAVDHIDIRMVVLTPSMLQIVITTRHRVAVVHIDSKHPTIQTTLLGMSLTLLISTPVSSTPVSSTPVIVLIWTLTLITLSITAHTALASLEKAYCHR